MSDYLATRHAAYATPPSQIAALIAELTPAPIRTIDKIERGYDHEVYQVFTTDDRLFVRIRRHGQASAADEVWAIDSARAAGVPVPTVLLCERRLLDGAAREVMIQRAVPGRPLAELIDNLDDTSLERCIVHAGAALARLHTVAVEGFYKRHSSVWDFSTFEAIAVSNLDARAAERQALLNLGFTDAEFDRLLETLAAIERRLPWRIPILLHGDLTLEHLFFDNDLTLTGVIDFGDFQGGSPIVDLAALLQLPRVRLDWLRSGYGPSEAWEGFAERRLAHQIGFTIGSLAHHASIGDEAATADLAAQLRHILRIIP